MASLTQWRWVSVSSRSWWCTGKPGVLQSMGSQRVRHDWAAELTDWFHLDRIHSSMWLFLWTVWSQIFLCTYSVLFTGHLNYPTPSFPIRTTLQPILNSFFMPFTLIFSPLNFICLLYLCPLKCQECATYILEWFFFSIFLYSAILHCSAILLLCWPPLPSLEFSSFEIPAIISKLLALFRISHFIS